jgi:hypothetical protein
MIATVRQIEATIEAGWFTQEDWFGAESHPYFGTLGARWVSVLVVCLALYGITVTAGATAQALRMSAALEWARGFLVFLVLLSWLVALQTIIVVEVARGVSGAYWPNEEQTLLVSSLIAILWPVAFGVRIDVRTVSTIFAVSVVTLGLAMVILEPDVLVGWATYLHLIRPPMDAVVTGRFLDLLPYLAPIGPVLWSAHRGWREWRGSTERE